MQQYFERELETLRRAGRAFAQANPQIAPQLGEASRDPDVERLLEGFAYLSAQIQAQSDAWVPSLAQDLLHVVAPEMQCPTPARTIVQLSADAKRVRTAACVPAGFALDIPTQAGDACRFQTTTPCQIGAIDALACRLERTGEFAHTLHIDIDVHASQGAQALSGATTRVFVSGGLGEASQLLLAILAHTTGLSLVIDGQHTTLCPQQHLRHAGFDVAPTLNAAQASMPPALRAMRDYLSLPEAFLFFDIVWPTALLQDVQSPHISLALRIEGAGALPEQIAADTLLAHCAVAINLFDASAMPLRQDGFRGPQLVRPDTAHPDDAHIYAITGVEGVCDVSFARVAYQAWRDCDMQSGASVRPYYHIDMRASSSQRAPDVYLSTHTPDDSAPDLRAQTLRVALLCTDGFAPAGIVAQSVCRLPKPGLVHGARVVCATSKPQAAPQGGNDSWVLLGHMASLRPGTDIKAHLQSQLRLSCSAFEAQSALGRAHARRIAGIIALEAHPAQRMHRGIATACTRFELRLDATHFASAGDAYLFAGLIDAWLADARGINQLHVLRVSLLPQEQDYSWPVRGLSV